MSFPWSAPHRHIHCIWEPLAYTVLKVIYSFVEMVFVFLFLFVVQEQFWKGDDYIFINISLCKNSQILLLLDRASESADLSFSLLNYKLAFRACFLNEISDRACSCLRPFSDFSTTCKLQFKLLSMNTGCSTLSKSLSLISFLHDTHIILNELFAVSQFLLSFAYSI